MQGNINFVNFLLKNKQKLLEEASPLVVMIPLDTLVVAAATPNMKAMAQALVRIFCILTFLDDFLEMN